MSAMPHTLPSVFDGADHRCQRERQQRRPAFYCTPQPSGNDDQDAVPEALGSIGTTAGPLCCKRCLCVRFMSFRVMQDTSRARAAREGRGPPELKAAGLLSAGHCKLRGKVAIMPRSSLARSAVSRSRAWNSYCQLSGGAPANAACPGLCFTALYATESCILCLGRCGRDCWASLLCCSSRLHLSLQTLEPVPFCGT